MKHNRGLGRQRDIKLLTPSLERANKRGKMNKVREVREEKEGQEGIYRVGIGWGLRGRRKNRNLISLSLTLLISFKESLYPTTLLMERGRGRRMSKKKIP